MKKSIIYLIAGLICLTTINAAFITYKDDEYWCSGKVTNETFIASCPSDYRVEGDWFKYYNYLENESVAYCTNDKQLIVNCEYNIENWNHPNVAGSPASSGLSRETYIQNTQNQIPEFTTITLGLALIGASFIYFKKRK